MMQYSQNFRIGMAHPFLRNRMGLCARCGRGQGESVHFEPVTRMTCQEANCEANAKGWFSVLDVTTPAHAEMATWIKQHSRRKFWEWPAVDALEAALKQPDITVTAELRAMLEGMAPGLIVFAFPPGQQCFKQHLDREVVFLHNRYRHTRPEDFNEDFNEQADKVNTALGRG